MNRDTTIYYGTYLICTMAATDVDVDMVRCSHNANHPTHEDAKFCSKCGAKTERTVRQEKAFQSLHDVYNDNVILPRADVQWLITKFSPIYELEVGEENEERLIYDPGSACIAGDEDSVTDFDPATDFPVPSPEEIEKLAELMGYTNIEVRRGIIVSISY